MLKKYTFRGGIHPLQERHGGKNETRGEKIREYIPDTVTIPMDIHIGAPSVPCVQKGDVVKLGQVIGEAANPRSIPVHASVSGTVTDVGMRQMVGKHASLCVTIQNDKQDEWVDLVKVGDVETTPREDIIPAIRNAGICGLGGACFPTHAKMTIPEGKRVDTLIINGAECETFLTADYRLMLEQPERIVDGARLSMRALGVDRCIIAIEDNKPEAIEAVQNATAGRTGITVAVLKTKYPQGGEKSLINALLKREVPSGVLPMDVQVVVLNVGTAAAIADAIVDGMPLISRITTVAGNVKQPSNLRVRIGTPVHDIIKACGGYLSPPGKIVFGGSMTGICMPDDTVSVTKANNGIIVLDQKEAALPDERQCIRCGRCIRACPIYLNPFRLKHWADTGNFEQAEKEHVMDCIVCGACSYVCPARRQLSASIKAAKDAMTARRVKQ